MVNKQGRQKKCVKIFLNFTYLHKTQPGQKTAGNFSDFFEGIYSPDVWVSRIGCFEGFWAMGHKQKSAKIFDSYLPKTCVLFGQNTAHLFQISCKWIFLIIRRELKL